MKLYRFVCVLAAFSSLCLLLAACGPAADPASAPEKTGVVDSAPETRPESTEPAASSTGPAAGETSASSTQAAGPTVSNSSEPDGAGTTVPSSLSPAPSGGGAAIAALAESLVGTPFAYGAAGPDKFDNSGLVYYCLKQNGISAPRRTSEMAQAGQPVEKAGLQPGDVVFFYNDTPGVAQYTGIYIGNQQFVACNSEEAPTKIQNIDWPYFVERYVAARRF